MASVIKRGKNSYRATVSINGEVYKKTIHAKNKHEANKKANIYEAKMKNQKIVKTSNMLFHKYAQKWIDNKRDELSPKTFATYRNQLNNHILPEFGNRKLNNLKPLDFIDYYKKLRKETDLSNRSIHHYHRLLHNMLSDAMRWELIEYNPLSKVKAPKYDRNKNKNYYSIEQAKKMLAVVEKENKVKYHIMIRLALMCGMRIGEITGLEWKDIDFNEQILTVQRTSQYVDRKVITKKPKNESSIRKIHFGDKTKELFEEWKKKQDLLSELLDDFENSDRIMINEKTGAPIHPATPRRWFEKFLKRNNLDKITLHGLRHTSASFMINSNADIETIASRLGHRDSTTTLKVYSHQLKKADKEISSKLENLLK